MDNDSTKTYPDKLYNIKLSLDIPSSFVLLKGSKEPLVLK